MPGASSDVDDTQRGSRARTREDADKGVQKCIELMTGGQWVTGKSHRLVAEEFKVSPSTVKDWATSASRVIRLAIEGDKDEIRARMFATLETVIANSLNKHVVDEDGEVLPSPDGRTAVAAVDTQAKLLGLHAPTKVDVRVEQYEQLAPPALHAKLIEQRRKLTESIDALEREHPELVSPAHRLIEARMKDIGIERMYAAVSVAQPCVNHVTEEKPCASCGFFGGHRYECPELHKPEEKCR